MTKIKTTKQRERILEVIRHSHNHLTADEVYHILRQEDQSVGVATVYRNLKSLYEHHMINRINHPEKGFLYDANLDEHYHLHCKVCNNMVDIDDMVHDELNREVEAKTGAKVDRHMIFFYGTCPDCLKKQAKHRS